MSPKKATPALQGRRLSFSLILPFDYLKVNITPAVTQQSGMSMPP